MEDNINESKKANNMDLSNDDIKIKLKNIKCIFLDIDNTLTNSENQITGYTIEILKKVKSKGIYIILCSGRPNQYTVEKSKLCNGSNIVISENGALIYNYDLDTVLFENVISKDTLNYVLEMSIDNNIDCVLNTVYKRYRHEKFKSNDYIYK